MSAPAATTPAAARSIPRDFDGGGGVGGGVCVFLEGFDISNAFYRGSRFTVEFSQVDASRTGGFSPAFIGRDIAGIAGIAGPTKDATAPVSSGPAVE